MFLKKLFCCFLIVLFFNSCNDSKTLDQNLSSKGGEEEIETSQINHSYLLKQGAQTTITDPALSPTQGAQTTITDPTLSPTQGTQTTITDPTLPPTQGTQTTITTPTTPPSTKTQTESNSSLLINYKNQTIGDIDLSITREQANQTLNLIEEKSLDSGFLLSKYKGDIGILWNKEKKAVEIYANTGNFYVDDSGTYLPYSIGQTIPFSSKKEKVSFLINLYNDLENTKTNCIEETKCFIIKGNQSTNDYYYITPKMKLLFMDITKNDQKHTQLITISFEKGNKTYQKTRQKILEKNKSNNDTSNASATNGSLPRLINYQNKSIGEFNANTTKEEVDQILTFASKDQKNIYKYKENFIFLWDETGKLKSFGYSFNDTTLTPPNANISIAEIGKVIPYQDRNTEFPLFFSAVYNTLENVHINCFREHKCNLESFDSDKLIFTLQDAKTKLVYYSDPQNKFITLLEVVFNFEPAESLKGNSSITPETSAESSKGNTITPETSAESSKGNTITPETSAESSKGNTITPETSAESSKGNSSITPETSAESSKGNTITPETSAESSKGNTITPETSAESSKGNSSITPDTSAESKLFIINYQNQSIAGIDFNTSREEANQILTVFSEENNFYSYKGGFYIQFNDKDQANIISVIKNEDTSFLFENKNIIYQLGNTITINDSEGLRNFFISTYNKFENTDIDCLKEEKCFQFENLRANMTGFQLPKMILWFTPINEISIKLTGITFVNE